MRRIHSDTFDEHFSSERIQVDLRGKSVRGVTATVVIGAGEFVVRLVPNLILARLLIPEHFGLVGMVTALTAVVDGLSTLGLSSATIQATKVSHQQCSNLFWVNLAGGACFTALIAAAGPAIAAFFDDGRLVGISAVIATTFIFGGLSVQHQALLQRQMKHPHLAFNRLGAAGVSAVVGVALAYFGAGYWSLVVREVARVGLVTLGSWALCPWVPARPRRVPGSGALLRFGRDMTLTQLLTSLITRLDSILIGRIGGATDLGFYRQAQNILAAPIDQLNGPILTVTKPALSRLQSEPARFRSYYRRILFFVSASTVPIGVFGFIYAAEIVSLFLGPNWTGAVPYVQILAIAAAVRPSAATTGVVMVACGRSGSYLVVAVAHSLALAVFMLVGIPWGPIGVAFAQMATSVALMVPKAYLSFRNTPLSLHDFLAPIAVPTLAGGVTMLVLHLVHGVLREMPVTVSLASGLVAGGLAHVGCLLCFREARSHLAGIATAFSAAWLTRKRETARAD